jgi:hypothetical protein
MPVPSRSGVSNSGIRGNEPLLMSYIVLPPIETEDLTPADVDNLTQTTRDSMLKNIMEMAHTEEAKVEARANGVSSAVQI